MPIPDAAGPAGILPVSEVRLTRDELVAIGERLGRSLAPPQVVALAGDLGAGKTTLIQAICRGYGVTTEVTSPTFALVHVYEAARSPVFHCDLYRLRDPSEVANIGWDDMLGEHALVLIEWPERAGDRLPEEATVIELDHVADNAGVRALKVRRA